MPDATATTTTTDEEDEKKKASSITHNGKCQARKKERLQARRRVTENVTLGKRIDYGRVKHDECNGQAC